MGRRMSGRAGYNGNIRGLHGPKAEKTISLALQGGGAHGAFTWGVLDAILEDERLAIEAITGTSAGAMNAVVMAEGYIEGGVKGARKQLDDFWQKISLDGNLSITQRGLFGKYFDFWSLDSSPGFFWLDMMSRLVSPYETNPMDVNPLRDALDEMICFEKLRKCKDVQLFIAATSVWTGKIRVFKNAELTADHIVASACLPSVFQAVEIEGEPFWDGGFMGNPALFPLFYETKANDILLVQVNPLERQETPKTAREIQNRQTEITFNGTLLSELRAIDFVARLVDQGKLSKDEYKRVFMHRIDGGAHLAEFAASSRMNAEWSFFQELKELGRKAAKQWLTTHYDNIGHKATLDLRMAYS